MISTRLTTVVSIVTVCTAFTVGIYFYPLLPQEVLSNWNALGILPGHVSKFLALFLLPTVTTILITLLLAAPQFPSLKKSIADFRGTYNFLILLLDAEFILFYSLTIAFNLGFHFPFGRFVVCAFGVLFFAVGTVLPDIKRNWLTGIRTPWTMTSDIVWEKTHLHASPLFQVVGVVACLGAVLPLKTIPFLFLLLVFATFWTIFYSYILHRRHR